MEKINSRKIAAYEAVIKSLKALSKYRDSGGAELDREYYESELKYYKQRLSLNANESN